MEVQNTRWSATMVTYNVGFAYLLYVCHYVRAQWPHVPLFTAVLFESRGRLEGLCPCPGCRGPESDHTGRCLTLPFPEHTRGE